MSVAISGCIHRWWHAGMRRSPADGAGLAVVAGVDPATDTPEHGSMSGQRARDLVGREDELAAIRAWLADRPGHPSAMLLDGEPGIGKSALLRVIREDATRLGFRVLAAAPTDAETRLAHAGLGDLLGPDLASVAPRIPEPQLRALEIALRLREPASAAIDDHALAMGCLNALRALSADGPVLVMIDDWQWLDAGTADVCRFALRRLRSEPVAVLVARRADADAPDPVVRDEIRVAARIHLGPLSLGAVHRLVHDRLDLSLARPTLRRLHVLARGNPLHALELGRALLDRRLTLGLEATLPTDLEDLAGARIGALPEPTRELLGAAALLARPTLEGLVTAFPASDPRADLEPAIGADVIRIQDGVV
jgi:predicted ATPase